MLLLVGMVVMWACSPLTLMKSRKKAERGVTTIERQVNDGVPSELPSTPPVSAALDSLGTVITDLSQHIDSTRMALLTDSLGAMADSVKAGNSPGLDSLGESLSQMASDLQENADGTLAGLASQLPALGDSIVDELPTHRQAAAALKRDTTTMDSLELVIYKYNKVIDDSLRLDSLNRQRKNGIDSPVEFSANDSLIYEAGSGMAHLFGSSHVKYQNMDLKSEKIYMCLDSSLVHATGALDSVGKMFGTPVFEMGSDTYESDTMAFNFKTKKGFIQQVYTEQEDGFTKFSVKVEDKAYNECLYIKKVDNIGWTTDLQSLCNYTWYMRVPEGYDGMVVVFFNSAIEWEDGKYIYEVLDQDALVYRVEG